MRVEQVEVTGPRPEPRLELPIAVWPTPTPVLLVAGTQTQGFVFPLLDAELAERIVRHWPRLMDWRLPADENRIQAGGFDGDCLSSNPRGSPWRSLTLPQPDARACAGLGTPPDQPGNPALFLENQDPVSGRNRVACYQPLKPLPPGGTTLVLRYRARAESGDGNLALAPELPLVIPASEQGAAAVRLRSRCQPMQPDAQDQEPDRWRYSLQGWVKPTEQWQTYYVIWEQPPFPTRGVHRVLRVWYTGTGKVWVDDVELFAWEPGPTP